ncbi:MAG: hypothetical protein P4L81_01805 [Candidatus Pacebacteria bacterium]|nr:hypothetical protein [Candidatus Paceibacterota bacterium]
MAYAALIDSNSNVLLSLNLHLAAIIFVSKCTEDTLPVSAVEDPNYLHRKHFWQKRFPLASLSAVAYPEWRWDFKTRRFYPAQPHLITESMRAKSKLANKKVQAISYIMSNLSAARHTLRTGVEFQETTHLLKRMEALEFKKTAGTDDPFRFPFVMQYADSAGIAPEQAADDILFKAKMEEDVLIRSEGTRLKYFRAMRNAGTIEEIDALLREFHADHFFVGDI